MRSGKVECLALVLVLSYYIIALFCFCLNHDGCLSGRVLFEAPFQMERIDISIDLERFFGFYDPLCSY